MECGGKHRDCHSPAFWWCLYHSPERLTHPSCHLNTESDLSTYCMCRFFKRERKRAACTPAQVLCVCELKSKSSIRAEAHSCDRTFLTVCKFWPSNRASLANTLLTQTCAACWSRLRSTTTAHFTHVPWSQHIWQFYDAVNPIMGSSLRNTHHESSVCRAPLKWGGGCGLLETHGII